MRRRTWLVLILCIVVVGGAVTLSVLPEVIRRIAIARIERSTGRAATIERIRVDVLTGRFVIRGFRLSPAFSGPVNSVLPPVNAASKVAWPARTARTVFARVRLLHGGRVRLRTVVLGRPRGNHRWPEGLPHPSSGNVEQRSPRRQGSPRSARERSSRPRRGARRGLTSRPAVRINLESEHGF